MVRHWTEKMFNLFTGDTITITFESTVIEYCNEIVENCAFVDIWNCSLTQDPIHLLDSDCALINCTSPPPTFDKWVKVTGGNWGEEVEAFVDDEVSFKIELTYYGNGNLSNISIADYLTVVFLAELNNLLRQNFFILVITLNIPCICFAYLPVLAKTTEEIAPNSCNTKSLCSWHKMV